MKTEYNCDTDLDNFPLSKSQKFVEYTQAYGGAASLYLPKEDAQAFEVEAILGMIVYRLSRGCAVVFGEPLCAKKDVQPLAQAFHLFCQNKKLCVVYLSVSEVFAKWALSQGFGALLETAEELILDPSSPYKVGTKARALRNKINLAERFFVKIEEYIGQDGPLEDQLSCVVASWVKGRKGPQIFLSDARLFEQRTGKRWFYATFQEKIVGVVLLSALKSQKGWLQQLLVTTSDAPLGTSELLIATVLETLKREGCRFYSLGIAQRKEMGEIIGLKRGSQSIARLLFKLASRVFRLEKRRRFLKKFQPQSAKAYLVFSTSKIKLSNLMGIKRALNVKLKQKGGS